MLTLIKQLVDNPTVIKAYKRASHTRHPVPALKLALAETSLPSRQKTQLVAAFRRARHAAQEKAWKAANPKRAAKIRARYLASKAA